MRSRRHRLGSSVLAVVAAPFVVFGLIAVFLLEIRGLREGDLPLAAGAAGLFLLAIIRVACRWSAVRRRHRPG